MAPYAGAARALHGAWRGGGTLAEALGDVGRAHAARGAHDVPAFVPMSALPRGEAYESFVARTRQVPVRETLHDALNALVWLRRPALKWALNAAHAAEIARHGVSAVRGARRDALTLLDENGALLAAPAPLVEALRARDWRTLFVDRRALWAGARFELVGHGLLEQLAAGARKALTAHAWIVPDGALDAPALPCELAPSAWCPLPVLGVPGWWPDNAHPAFYDDTAVFRPPHGTRAAAPALSALSRRTDLHPPPKP